METSTTLLRRVRDTRDQDAWGEFVAFYQPLLLAYVARKGLREYDAHDVVQNILIALLRALPTFELNKTRGRFRSWLYQVSANAVEDWRRARRRHARTGGDWEGTGVEPVAPTVDPDKEWEEITRSRVFQEVLPQVRGETDPKTWACFEQHLLLRRSGQDVGAQLGLKPNTVYVNASRVLKRLGEACLARMKELDS
jgi:RNA polymerase sigma-70 factor (ECF subfamily)